ncbi:MULTISPECIES: PSP1 domain-containing protein [Chryseobacterium]|uniref:Cell fate regulator YaaT (PSP1 superfamily) n=1 Tax=Chryseobacterium camelliae TaxID=1265445 RepID=A0ABU0TPX4_9FLAO|nr:MULTISPECIES: regulatory iron-sulfur-containing complex subunit RicT [Chryseobacterium]MDT3407772.1 cell fate regulator YaaT (PSP1 superfamily) [Pseudacidovorax intermedius]MDQ1098375.1 cell fate regulator YaaT (PSP1 superfamily) [Chryseobacterium camelliae]MDQ1102300.1 cell fate regulator YaaT (PSP1 superfamily) [Chryseobacterium sp. SORGH_AS_1048]MDR6085737.1 cell fate regulator YaaT (PSP1 superfamily) [Chryseobacterium sp. SORGH_AS_0909]MDR6130102.1 cell fate regulator YaaT (PSP1 superfa
MSCGCKTSGDSAHSCGPKKTASGCENVNTCGNSYKLSVFDWLSNINNPAPNRCDFVEVRFKNDRKSFYKNVNNIPLHIGSVVTVESSPGHDVGVVSLTGELVKIQMKKKRFSEESALKIYRQSNQKDIEVWQEARKKEDSVKIEARKIAHRLGLEMKVTDVEYQGDASKVTFYYTADNRVDFRQLIKDYAAAFRTKIDMKQIGFRQEAAKVGGIGSCGRELCCSTWLTDFRSVNTNVARYQQLSINPQKLAGQCGKLKCCLNYELDSYLDALHDFPPSSTTLETEKGKAFCIKIDVFKKKMWFAYVENSIAWYDFDIDLVKKLISKNKRGEKALPLEELKQPETSFQSIDLIQENNVDRFEKKKSRNRNKPNNNNQQNQGQRKSRPEKSENPNSQSGNRQPKPQQQQQKVQKTQPEKTEVSNSADKKPAKKNFKKKYPPKKDRNA